jgi:HK97 family phage major capsid protein
MPDLQKIQRERNEKLEKMRSLLTKADTEKRELIEAEINEFNGLDEECKRMGLAIERELRLQNLENEKRDIPDIKLDNNNTNSDKKEGRTNEGGFENLGEFFATVATNRNDERLRPYYRSAGGGENRTAQKMGIGTLGGFAIPDQFLNTIKSVAPQASIVRPGATVIPAGDPPDAKIHVPALDQGAARNMYGGIQVVHSGETLTITETNTNLRQITLEPKSLKGFIPVSNELINNWSAATTFLQTQMRLAIIGAEDYDFFRGTGVNSALGIINSPCRFNVTRAGAAAIAYADVLGMFARAKLGGGLVWIASQTTIPQLATIRDAGNNNLWIQNTIEGVPSRMLGFPILFNDRSPALGTAGDLCLVDRSYYMIKDGSGPRVDISTDFLFQNDETCFRIVWMVDGQAWLREPIPLEGSTANTISPFVVLN